MLLPMVDLIEQSRLAIDELIDVAGRATIERVLQLSGEQVAGPRTPGKQREEVVWHGNQQGRACLKEHGSSQPGMPVAPGITPCLIPIQLEVSF